MRCLYEVEIDSKRSRVSTLFSDRRSFFCRREVFQPFIFFGGEKVPTQKHYDRQIIRRSWRDDIRKIFIMREPLPGWLENSFFFMAICLIVVLYSVVAYSETNTLIPTWGKLATGFTHMMTDPRSGDHMLWMDTVASFSRLLPALAIASLLGIDA